MLVCNCNCYSSDWFQRTSHYRLAWALFHIHTYIHTYIHTNIHIHRQTHKDTHIFTHMHTHVHILTTLKHNHTLIHTYCIHIHPTYTHICTHPPTYTCMYTHTYTNKYRYLLMVISISGIYYVDVDILAVYK